MKIDYTTESNGSQQGPYTYFSEPQTVDHYFRATANVGLWTSERAVIESCLSKTDALLELGCGTGRITFGLHKLGYRDITAVDVAPGMIAAALEVNMALETPIRFSVEDATQLSFDNEVFNAAIFGFNGWMQIPYARNREKALEEIRRVLKPHGLFIFTTLDQDITLCPHGTWENEASHWQSRVPSCFDLGDIHIATPDGSHFMHVPTFLEIRKLLKTNSFEVLDTFLRDDRFVESHNVVNFADNLRFWITQKQN